MIDRLKELVAFMREEGVAALEMDGTKIVLGPKPPPRLTVSTKDDVDAGVMQQMRELGLGEEEDNVVAAAPIMDDSVLFGED